MCKNEIKYKVIGEIVDPLLNGIYFQKNPSLPTIKSFKISFYKPFNGTDHSYNIAAVEYDTKTGIAVWSFFDNYTMSSNRCLMRCFSGVRYCKEKRVMTAGLALKYYVKQLFFKKIKNGEL